MNLQSYKGRNVEEGQLVEVYFNLHEKKFSIRDKKTRLVLAHANSVLVEDASFKVNENDRQRVIAERSKNVHAYVVGSYVGTAVEDYSDFRKGYYNPYEVATFVDKETQQPLGQVEKVYCENKQINYK